VAKLKKTFLKSHYKVRKKEKKNKTNITKLILVILTLDCLNIEVLAEIHMKEVKDLTNILILLRKEISQLELEQIDTDRQVRRI